jgi:hypothetical protein
VSCVSSMFLQMETSSTENVSFPPVLGMSVCSILSSHKITSVSGIVSFLSCLIVLSAEEVSMISQILG